MVIYFLSREREIVELDSPWASGWTTGEQLKVIRSEGMEERKLPGKRNLTDISVTSCVAEILLSDVSRISLDAHSKPVRLVLFYLYI